MEQSWKALKARCIICGKEEAIQPEHEMYKKVKFMPNAPYVCSKCSGASKAGKKH